jgi:hypothetical protein
MPDYAGGQLCRADQANACSIVAQRRMALITLWHSMIPEA